MNYGDAPGPPSGPFNFRKLLFLKNVFLFKLSKGQFITVKFRNCNFVSRIWLWIGYIKDPKYDIQRLSNFVKNNVFCILVSEKIPTKCFRNITGVEIIFL